MISFEFNGYTVLMEDCRLPQNYELYVERAAFHDAIESNEEDASWMFLAVSRPAEEWPSVCITQRYAPYNSGFSPGVLLVAESQKLFLGAGTSVLAYDMSKPSRLWQEQVDCGFWGWKRVGSTVLMASELEFSAWTEEAVKLWSTYVEPPWHYEVNGEEVTLDVMGDLSRFSLRQGPRQEK